MAGSSPIYRISSILKKGSDEGDRRRRRSRISGIIYTDLLVQLGGFSAEWLAQSKRSSVRTKEGL